MFMGRMLEIVYGDILEVLALENPLNHICSPFGVLRGKRGVPPVKQIELDGDDISLADRLQVVVGVSDGLMDSALGGLFQGEDEWVAYHQRVESPAAAVPHEAEDRTDVVT